MNAPPDYKSEIESRVRECKLQARALDIWLSALKPANLLLVVGAGLLSLFAGASILTESKIITAQTAGLMALASAALTLIHNLLQCDPHQAECRRLRAAYEGLWTKYDSLDVLIRLKSRNDWLSLTKSVQPSREAPLLLRLLGVLPELRDRSRKTPTTE